MGVDISCVSLYFPPTLFPLPSLLFDMYSFFFLVFLLIPLPCSHLRVASCPTASQKMLDKDHAVATLRVDPGAATDVSSDTFKVIAEDTETRDEKLGEGKWIWVLDPMTRKLRVPVHFLVPTQATVTSGTVPSLCIAFLEGRCRHPWCRQAHVLPSAIPQLRYDALHAPTCCHLHHDPHDISDLTRQFQYIRVGHSGGHSAGGGEGEEAGEAELIPTERVASTVGLRRYLVQHGRRDTDGPREGSVLEIPGKYVCRLHLAHRCRYLEDCNNIHVCREYELRLQPPPPHLSVLQGLTPLSRAVCIGDVTYNVTALAVGDVRDEDFNRLCEAQKLRLGLEGSLSVHAGGDYSASTLATPLLVGQQQDQPSGEATIQLRVYDIRSPPPATPGKRASAPAYAPPPPPATVTGTAAAQTTATTAAAATTPLAPTSTAHAAATNCGSGKKLFGKPESSPASRASAPPSPQMMKRGRVAVAS